jgi:two-component system NtrC family sensor kinase
MSKDESSDLKNRIRQLEAELENSREKLAELEVQHDYSNFLINRALEGIAVASVDKKSFAMTFTLWNDRMIEMTGYTMEEVNEKGILSSLFRDTKLRKKARQRIKTVMTNRILIREEWACHSKDGRSIVLSISPSIISETDSQVDVLFIIGDITKITELNQQLFQAEKLSSIGKMVSGIAHEINNPLTGITGFSEMLLSHGDLAEDVKENVTLIYNESVRARKIVNDLLIFARRHSPEKKLCPLSDVLKEVLSLAGRDLEKKGIRTDVYYETKIPLIIFGDRHQLHQVFLNIIDNAIDALLEMKGERRIRVRTEWVKNRARVVIADNGHGMDQKTLARIFDPFFTTKEATDGTGLGLSISYGIVKEHRGKIYVKSAPGNGTRFTIELPLAGKDRIPTVDDPDESIEEADSDGSLVRERLRGRKVLIVDDEEIIRRLLSSFLQSSGMIVETAKNGAEGLEKLGTCDYDLILSDFAMPEIDGRKIYEELKKTAPQLIDRLVFMSGDVRDKARDFFEEYDIECLQKPFELAKLRELLERRL